jgi:hypothetical protein
MRTFRPVEQAHRFLDAHTAVHNVINLGTHLVFAAHYRHFQLHGAAAYCVRR